MTWTLNEHDDEAVKAAVNYEEHKEELSDISWEYPTVLMKDDEIILVHWRPEPEDATLQRDFYWVITLLNEHAS